MSLPKHTVITTDDHLWEIDALVNFLNTHQGQDIVLNANPEAHSLEACGLYSLLDQFSFKSVTIHTWNVLETHSKYTVVQKDPKLFFVDPQAWDKWNIPDDYLTWTGKYVFGAFYGRPTADRLGISSYLYTEYPTLSKMQLAFNPHNEDQRSFFELTKLFEYDENSIPRLATLIPKLPMQDPETIYNPPYYNYDNSALLAMYPDIFVDIVSEPNVAGNSFFFTEKLVRAILLKKPFIVMGPRDFLCHFRQMGFKTFYDFWSEDYDGYELKERYTRILQLINSLATRDDLSQVYTQMESILEHNRQLILTGKCNKEITQV